MRHWALLLLLPGLGACGVNPVPEPPARPELTGSVTADGCTQCDGTIFLVGTTLNATRVWAVNLDKTDPPASADVGVDGSFSLAIAAIEGDEIRVQARRDAERSDPVDLLVPSSGALLPAPRPLADCLTAPLELDFGAIEVAAAAESRSIHVDSSCADAVTLASIALRVPSAVFIPTAPTTPLTLASGDSTSIEIAFDPASAELSEEILLVEIDSPSPDRRPVTLLGTGL